MNIITVIICVILALCIGAGITYFLVPKHKGDSDADERISEMENQISEKDIIIRNSENKHHALEAEILKLKSQLRDRLEGKIDLSALNSSEETEKLKKKIRSLEDEIDDLEGDIDDSKKKYKHELSQLNKDLLNAERQSKKLAEEKQQIQDELEDKVTDLKLKIESLSFVKEILNATTRSDEAAMYDKISGIRNYILSDIKDKLNSLDCRLPNEDFFFKEGLEKWVLSLKKTWITGKTTIAFVGEFSAGKTSIVNRILSQDDPNVPLLPVSMKATTAIPTYITGGSNEKYSFFSPDNRLKALSEETFKKVNKDILGQIEGISSLIKYFVMAYKNENLNEISILDTPGFSSNDNEDAQRTIEVINECDALFWVFDVNAGTVNKSSLNIIKEHLKKPLYVVINKVDTKAKSAVDSVEKLIRSTLQKENIKIEGIVRFSSKEPLQPLMIVIKRLKENKSNISYIDKLRDEILKLQNDKSAEIKKQQTDCKELKNKLDYGEQEGFNLLDHLYNQCEQAASIPHKKKHLFSSERFEMSLKEYDELIESLSGAIAAADNSHELYEELFETQKKYVQVLATLSKQRQVRDELDDVLKELDKKLKILNYTTYEKDKRSVSKKSEYDFDETFSQRGINSGSIDNDNIISAISEHSGWSKDKLHTWTRINTLPQKDFNLGKLIIGLENTFGITTKDNDYKKATTIDDYIAIVKRALDKKNK